MERIRNTAATLQPMLVIFALFYLWKTAGGTVDFALLSPELWLNDDRVETGADIAMGTRITYLALWLAPIIFGFLALGIAASLLGLVQQDILFDARIARRFRWVGLAVAASGAADLFANFVTPCVLSWHNSSGVLPPSFYFNSESAGLLLCGGGFYLVGWIMAEAISIAHDNQGFI